jgi:hypothetical protein
MSQMPFALLAHRFNRLPGYLYWQPVTTRKARAPSKGSGVSANADAPSHESTLDLLREVVNVNKTE